MIEIGKQLLIARDALTTFSIANDVAKYFAIIPAMFAGVYPGLRHLNVMHLHSPTSAITSAIIFNALVIIGLIPLQPRPSAGAYDPKSSGASNLGPNSEDLLKAVEERRAAGTPAAAPRPPSPRASCCPRC